MTRFMGRGTPVAGVLIAIAVGWTGARAADEGIEGVEIVDHARAAGEPPAVVLETRHFAFHSDPWQNLHHFLYQWARDELGIASGRQEVVVAERHGPQPTGEGAREWSDAVAFYREHVASRDHFDLPMLELKAGLLGLGGDPTADPPDDIAGIAARLGAAMPVYLATWWTGHDAANRAWIEHVGADVSTYESRWVATVSRLFGGEWVEGRLRIDVAAYANWAGGYTSNEPPHTVIWSRDDTNGRGLYGLELVFHESGHVTPLGAPLRRTVADVFRSAGVDEPGNLRHLLLFATAGEVVREIAAARGRPEHVPYVVAEGLTGFAGWAPLWPAVQEHWVPVVRGGGGPVPALEAIAEALREGASLGGGSRDRIRDRE